MKGSQQLMMKMVNRIKRRLNWTYFRPPLVPWTRGCQPWNISPCPSHPTPEQVQNLSICARNILEENSHYKVKSPDFQTEGVVRMEENIVGFDVEVADPSLVQILQGFSKLGTKCTNCINNEMHQSFIKLHSIEKGTFEFWKTSQSSARKVLVQWWSDTWLLSAHNAPQREWQTDQCLRKY